MQAIVYTSASGFTKRYAEALAQSLALPCYSLEQAGSSLEQKAQIIYLGWLMAGGIKGLSKAKRRFAVQAVGAVGMQPENKKTPLEAQQRYKLDIPFFYLPGGYAPERLDSAVYRIMMKTMGKVVSSRVNKKANASEEEKEMAKAFVQGCDFWQQEHLQPLLDWYAADKH
jgi:hypothetical protein